MATSKWCKSPIATISNYNRRTFFNKYISSYVCICIDCNSYIPKAYKNTEIYISKTLPFLTFRRFESLFTSYFISSTLIFKVLMLSFSNNLRVRRNSDLIQFCSSIAMLPSASFSPSCSVSYSRQGGEKKHPPVL